MTGTTTATGPKVHPGTGRADEPGRVAVESPTGQRRWYPTASMSVNDAAPLLGWSRSKAFRKARSGGLPTVTIDGRKYVTAAAVDRLLNPTEYAGVADPAHEPEFVAVPEPVQPAVFTDPNGIEVDEYGFEIEPVAPLSQRVDASQRLASVTFDPEPDQPLLEFVPETGDGYGGGLLVPGVEPRPATPDEIEQFDGPDANPPGAWIPYATSRPQPQPGRW